MCDLMWSDPDDDIQGWGISARGAGYVFGPHHPPAPPSRTLHVRRARCGRRAVIPTFTVTRRLPPLPTVTGPDIADQFLYANGLELIARCARLCPLRAVSPAPRAPCAPSLRVCTLRAVRTTHRSHASDTTPTGCD